jgi:hypothetical protein
MHKKEALMKKFLIPFAICLCTFFGMSSLLSQQNQEEGKFQKTVDTYLDTYWKFFPTAATLAGYHKYDDKLEDLSEKSLDKHHDDLDVFNQELVTKVDKTKLGAEAQIDYDIIRNAIDLELMRHENLLPWEYNPVFYNEIILHSLKSLLTKEFAPLDARMKGATERAKLLPGLIKQARENLKTPPQIFTETAAQQFPGILDFYKTQVPQLIGNASSDLKSRFQAEWVKAVAALEEYQVFLQTQLLPRSTGNFRLGDQAHSRLLSLTGEFSIPPTELVARAKADYNNLRREMFLVCIPFYRIMYPQINLEQMTTQRGEEEVRNIVIQGVLDKIKSEHATKENFLEQVKTNSASVKAFLLASQIIPLPDAELTIESMPSAERGLTWTRLLTPGAYETGGTFSAQIAPLPDSWTEDQAKSFLEEYNNFYLIPWTVRNVYPGPFVPLFFTAKHPSLPRKLYPNMMLLKGWPVYIEEMLITSGFNNFDLRLRLNQLKFLLKAVIDFQLELNIHQAGMTKEQAIAYMTRAGFQAEVEAERKWNRILLKPGDAASPYIGYQEILDMEKDYRKLKGDAFSQKEFLQKLLSYGALPIRQLKARMAQ